MNTQRIVHSRLASLSPFGRFTAWVNARREARRARRIEEESIEFLRAMGPKLRDDIGIDIKNLGGSDQMLANRNPHALAPWTVSQSPSRSSGRRKRS